MTAIIVGVLATMVTSPASPADAADGRAFDPGMIITDEVFYDSSSMTLAQIQSFLNARVPTCAGGYVCLKDYRQTTTSQPRRSEGCSAYTGQAGESAALIIYKVSRACGISPRSILVLLEKEQGLVSDSTPSSRQYRLATGYGCPDTAACDSLYYGFFNQVYNAAWQFRKYRANPTIRAYQAGRYNTIYWHPNTACGTSRVYIQNQATAGLYIYTPYRPNAAALANLYGAGDSCSSYGNRNFWRLFTDWFGSTGSYAVHSLLQPVWTSTGGATGTLGYATSRHVAYSDGGVGQEFQRGWAYGSAATGAYYTQASVGRSYIALGGPPGVLGYPTSNPKPEPNSGRSQRFQKGWLYWSKATSIHRVSGRIGTSYATLRGPSGVLGYPLAAEVAGPDGGAGQRFQYGWLWTSPTTSIHRLSGRIAQSYVTLGGPSGRLGYPVAAQAAEAAGWVSQAFQAGRLYDSSTGGGIHYTLSVLDEGYRQRGGPGGALGGPADSTRTYGDGFGQRFAKGWLYWSPDAGYQVVSGAIATRYAALGGPAGRLGFPVAAPVTADGWTTQAFENGVMHSSRTGGTFALLEPMATLFAEAGGAAGAYGAPAGDTSRYADGGMVGRFTRSTLYWSPATGLEPTVGRIGVSHAALGGGGGILGYPTAPQTGQVGGGLAQTFTKGTLYWSPDYGIHYALSAIDSEYRRLGGVGGMLGHPVDSTRSHVDAGFGQRFRHGSLYWSAATGYRVSRGVIDTSYRTLGGPSGILGYPVAAETAEAGGGVSQRFEDGWLVWSSRTSIDRIATPIGEHYFAVEGGTGGSLGYPLDSTVSPSPGVLEQRFEHGNLRWTASGGTVRF
ncbi:LGFP repeat-containing protein [Agromyces sp. GXQ0307]|uniref:LGFP repeat-containing protein n=1 Tax=Agromyces sp. GXQ0307 TaxID=3377835 RepID=UPI00383B965C